MKKPRKQDFQPVTLIQESLMIFPHFQTKLTRMQINSAYPLSIPLTSILWELGSGVVQPNLINKIIKNKIPRKPIKFSNQVSLLSSWNLQLKTTHRIHSLQMNMNESFHKPSADTEFSPQRFFQLNLYYIQVNRFTTNLRRT